MSDKQAKLLAALRKRPSDSDVPAPPLVPAEPGGSTDSGTLKLRKSNLLGVVTWEQALKQLALNGAHDWASLSETLTKMLGNVVANPAEAKYRKIRHGNPNFAAKVYGHKGAPALLELAGFKKDTLEDGFLVLPESADLALVQRAIDALAAHAAERAAAEVKRKEEQAKKDAAAREARAQKARDEAAPADYDAAVAANASLMVDEDEAMVEAIEEYFDAHEALKAGRALDSYAIERQVPGAGGVVVATVAASAGTQYYDYLATMKRGAAGSWTVLKIEAA